MEITGDYLFKEDTFFLKSKFQFGEIKVLDFNFKGGNLSDSVKLNIISSSDDNYPIGFIHVFYGFDKSCVNNETFLDISSYSNSTPCMRALHYMYTQRDMYYA